MEDDRPPETPPVGRLRAWLRRRRAASDKRRAEYLHLGGDRRWRRLLINLHPESLFSFFTSRAGVWLVFKLFMTVFLLALLAMTFAYFHYRREVPATVLELQSCVEGRPVEFYDRTGQTLLWTAREGGECQPIQLDEVSPYLIDALISTEDKDFFEHPGYKITSIARSVINNLRGRPRQGGSTITQQYIKNAILRDSDRSFERKIKEIVLLPEIESVYSKEEILTAYLNTISFGSVYSGIEAAAQGYFGKPAADLSLDESALLIAAVNAPNYTWENPDLHLKKRDVVLGEMLEDGKISQQEHDAAVATATLAKVRAAPVVGHGDDITAAHFVLTARQQLNSLLCQDEENCADQRQGGYRVITTLDLPTQQATEAAVAATIDALEADGYNNAALAVLDNRSREVLSLAGGRDFFYPDFGQVNHITETRPPAELWSALVYAALLDNRSEWGAGRTLYDYPTFGVAADEEAAGPVSLRRALAESLATPTVKAAYLAGPANVEELSSELQLAELPDCQQDCAVQRALGNAFVSRLDNLANLYATFGSDGHHQELTYIKQVVDGRGQTVYERQAEAYGVFDRQTAFIVNHVLADSSFKPAGLRQHSNLAFKAGFSADFRDNPFVAYTPQITLAGWVGEHWLEADSPDKDHPSASRLQTELANNFLNRYRTAAGLGGGWSRPAGLQVLRTNLLSGRLGGGVADYYPGKFRPATVPATATVSLDRVTGKLATGCTPATARRTLTTTAIWPELAVDDPAYDDWMRPIWQNLGARLGGTIPTQIDDLHKCTDRRPQIDVQIAGDCRQACQLTVEATAGTHDLKAINIKTGNDDARGLTENVDGRSVRATYDYKSTAVDLRVLRIEIVDQALYTEAFVVDL